VAVKPIKENTDRFGLVASFMELSDLMFGKGWNATGKKRK
tara:strand:- start:31 stop:150 length:120 start_codon:yes stop_codon:yes gene_type:complete